MCISEHIELKLFENQVSIDAEILFWQVYCYGRMMLKIVLSDKKGNRPWIK